MGVPWKDCMILRGCVGVPLERLQDFEGLCYTMWVCIGQIAGF